jgi:energy-coupling factor transporter ATP-binding protein EcfA2
MALVSLRDVGLAFGGPRLLDRVNWQIERGERVCLLGRNGEGKSTLLRLLQGEIPPDEGEVLRQQGLRIARLPQEVSKGHGQTVGGSGRLRAAIWPGTLGTDDPGHLGRRPEPGLFPAACTAASRTAPQEISGQQFKERWQEAFQGNDEGPRRIKS